MKKILFYSGVLFSLLLNNLNPQANPYCNYPPSACADCNHISEIQDDLIIRMPAGNSEFCYYHAYVTYRLCNTTPPTYEIEIGDIQATSSDCNVNTADNILKMVVKEALYQIVGKFPITGNFQVNVKIPSCVEKCAVQDNPTLHKVVPCSKSQCCQALQYLNINLNEITVTQNSTLTYPYLWNQCELIQCSCNVVYNVSFNDNCLDGCQASNLPIGPLKSSFSPPSCYDNCDYPWISNPNQYETIIFNSCTLKVHYEIRESCGEKQIRLTHIAWKNPQCDISDNLYGDVYKEAIKKLLKSAKTIFPSLNNLDDYTVVLQDQPCWSYISYQDQFGRYYKFIVPCGYYLCCKTYYSIRKNNNLNEIYIINTIPPGVSPVCESIFWSCLDFCPLQDDILYYSWPKASLGQNDQDENKVFITLEYNPIEIVLNTNGEIINFELYNIFGIQVEEAITLIRKSDSQIIINTKYLSSGIYFYKININNEIKTNSFLIIN